jgi:hypothetical protein
LSVTDLPNLINKITAETIHHSMSRLWKSIWKLPVVGDLFYYVFFVIGWYFICPAAAKISGCQRLKFGTSIFWIPKQKVQAIRDGVELLRSHDSEMYFRLTTKQHLVIYYSPPYAKGNRKTNHRFFLIPDKFIEIGPEGVACLIAESLMLAVSVHRINQYRLDSQERAAVKLVSRNMMEWLSKHSFHPNLISAYQKVVNRQAQSIIGS